jgi:hypothetical protein
MSNEGEGSGKKFSAAKTPISSPSFRFMRGGGLRSMRARHFFHTFVNSLEALDNG